MLVLIIYPMVSSNLVSSSFDRVYLTNQIGLVMTNTKVPRKDKKTGEIKYVTEERGPFMNFIWKNFVVNNLEFDVPVINYVDLFRGFNTSISNVECNDVYNL